jgi:hypothetical protein
MPVKKKTTTTTGKNLASKTKKVAAPVVTTIEVPEVKTSQEIPRCRCRRRS